MRNIVLEIKADRFESWIFTIAIHSYYATIETVLQSTKVYLKLSSFAPDKIA